MKLEELDPKWIPCSCVREGSTEADFLLWTLNSGPWYAFCVDCTDAVGSPGIQLRSFEKPQERLI